MSNDPSSGDQSGWPGQQGGYPGYGQQRGDQPGYGSAYPPPTQQGAYGQAPSWQQPVAPQPQAQGASAWPGGPPTGGAAPGGYPAGTGPGGTSMSGQAPGFVAAMTDFNFNSFATPAVIKVLYILNIVLAGLILLVVVVSSIPVFSQSPGFGLLYLVGGVLAVLVALIYARVILELLYANVRTSEDVRILRDRQQ